MTGKSAPTGISVRRLLALSRKESLQIVRDPSSVLIAFVLPIVMLFIFGYGVNLDTGRARIGVVVEDAGAEGWRIADALAGSPFLTAVPVRGRAAAATALGDGAIRGFVVIPQDFTREFTRPSGTPVVQVVTDGSEPNTAAFVASYVRGAIANADAAQRGVAEAANTGGVELAPRYWFNPAVVSRNVLVPGSIVIVMTVIGALLTSLVVAREWERGTMEALLSTPVTKAELLLSKLLPYYALGMMSMALCVAAAVFIMDVPYHGSLGLLAVATTAFLGTALGSGLMLSTILRNQFNAAQAALNTAFLPAMMLSGFVYEIASMPGVVQVIASALPARYFVTILQTLFLSDHAGRLFWTNVAALVVIATVFLVVVTVKTKRTLD
ncbi:MAG TPA: ABC transporter permease [Pseudoxanthomonas sp.]|nr:ABC transporter permease [Pseudoxanthomonas sp.]